MGIYEVHMDIDEDESYVRELFHFCKELDGTKRMHRSPEDFKMAPNHEVVAENFHILNAKVNEPNLDIEY